MAFWTDWSQTSEPFREYVDSLPGLVVFLLIKVYRNVLEGRWQPMHELVIIYFLFINGIEDFYGLCWWPVVASPNTDIVFLIALGTGFSRLGGELGYFFQILWSNACVKIFWGFEIKQVFPLRNHFRGFLVGRAKIFGALKSFFPISPVHIN